MYMKCLWLKNRYVILYLLLCRVCLWDLLILTLNCIEVKARIILQTVHDVDASRPINRYTQEPQTFKPCFSVSGNLDVRTSNNGSNPGTKLWTSGADLKWAPLKAEAPFKQCRRRSLNFLLVFTSWYNIFLEYLSAVSISTKLNLCRI